MKKGTIAFLAIVVVLAIVSLQFVFILSEGEQAVVTRFGRITKVHTEAGLKVKTPAIDKVTRYSKKILSWDGDPQSLPTKEKLNILVDTTARWRIVDARIFYQRITEMNKAYARLDNVIESAVRTVVSQYPLSESVRSSNIIFESENAILDFESSRREEDTVEDEAVTETDQPVSAAGSGTLTASSFVQIDLGRKHLSDEMLRRSQGSMPEYGIELLDVVIRQIRYSDKLTQSVYDRMISERRKVASGYRSDGEGQKAEWLGRLNRDRSIKVSTAEKESATIRAEGDGEAARIYASTYSADPEFYSFWKALQSYRSVLPQQNKVLSTDMDFFRYLYEIE